MSRHVGGVRAMLINDEINQDDLMVQADIQKLVFISKCIADEFGEYVEDIYVSPASIIQTPLRDIDEMHFLIFINPSVNMEPKEFTLEDFVSSYVKQECPELKNVSTIATYDKNVGGNYLCLYACDRFKRLKDVNFTINELMFLKKMLDNKDIKLSLSPTWDNYRIKNFMIHIKDISVLFNTIKEMLVLDEESGIKVEEASTWAEYTFIPIIGYDSLPYEIPYYFLKESDLDLQQLEQLLKDESNVPHI